MIGEQENIYRVTIQHQRHKSVGEKEYAEFIQGLRNRIVEQSIQLFTRWKEGIIETRSRAIQTARGNLSQFLATPLTSDIQEIERILADEFAQATRLAGIQDRFGRVDTSNRRYVFLEATHAPVNRLLATGKRYLKKIGFAIGTEKPEIRDLHFIFGDWFTSELFGRFFVESGHDDPFHAAGSMVHCYRIFTSYASTQVGERNTSERLRAHLLLRASDLSRQSEVLSGDTATDLAPLLGNTIMGLMWRKKLDSNDVFNVELTFPITSPSSLHEQIRQLAELLSLKEAALCLTEAIRD